jgi:lysophospholipase L1-like esterase
MTRFFSSRPVIAIAITAAISFSAVFFFSSVVKQALKRPEAASAPAGAPDRDASPHIAAGAKGAKAKRTPPVEPAEQPALDAQTVGDEPIPVLADAKDLHAGARRTAITILQIGDSHTSADFFTGTLRKILQERFGNGGPGYVTAGHPHIGVRSDTLRVSDTSGWTYEALQKSQERSHFALAGFNAVTSSQGRTMTFTADRPLSADLWEVEVFRQPGGGSIEIRLDGVVSRSVDLDAEKLEPVVIQLQPRKNTQRLSVTTTGHGRVSLSSVAAYKRGEGLTYNSVGFPGATIDIVNRFNEKILSAELKRMAPQIVVLSFGSNEGFNDNLDIERYSKNYRLALSKIRAALPNARIVIIGPPDGARRGGADCGWQTPPKLNSVRKAQSELAQSLGFVYWNWASIMPQDCGAHRWVTKSPSLMAKDHLHFSKDGYALSAEEFSKVLIPVIEKVQASVNVVSNY